MTDSEGKEPHTVESVVLVTLISAFAVGFGIFFLMEDHFSQPKRKMECRAVI